jgi:hypothetical protein
MIQGSSTPPRETSEREALRRRIRKMYDWFNRGLWEKCFTLIDPQLIKRSRVDLPAYSERLRAFKEVYGGICPWHIIISMHLDERSNKHDQRPFAYVYVVWQDAAHGFHMFRERWVKESNRWYTRVVGLVPNSQESA